MTCAASAAIILDDDDDGVTVTVRRYRPYSDVSYFSTVLSVETIRIAHAHRQEELIHVTTGITLKR